VFPRVNIRLDVVEVKELSTSRVIVEMLSAHGRMVTSEDQKSSDKQFSILITCLRELTERLDARIVNEHEANAIRAYVSVVLPLLLK
jgi:hypothetical protein